MSIKLRVAVVGCGIGRSHIKSYQTLPDQFEVVAICDIDRVKAQKAAEELSIPAALTDFAEACRRDDLDIIDLCTPPFLHREQMLQALAAGKHVICEKPLVGSLAELDEVAAAEKQSGRRVMPILQYRFGHGVQKLKHLLAEDLGGRLEFSTVETHWSRGAEYYSNPWRGKWKTERGGVLLAHAVHAHDILYFVAGPIKNVFARAATRINNIEVEDSASLSLEMADGSFASLSATLGSRKQITRHRFCFQKLMAESQTAPYTNTKDPWEFAGGMPERNTAIEESLSRFVPLPEWFEGQFARYHAALSSGGELPVTLTDARAAMELITAAYYSAETGQPIELPLGSDHPYYTDWTPEKYRNA